MSSCHCNSPFNPIYSARSQCEFNCSVCTCKLSIRDIFLHGSGHSSCRRKGEKQEVKAHTRTPCPGRGQHWHLVCLWAEPGTSAPCLPLKISANKPNRWVLGFIREERFKSRTLLLLDTKRVLSLPAVTLVTARCLSFAGITFIFILY